MKIKEILNGNNQEERRALATACSGLIFAGILIALSVLIILKGWEFLEVHSKVGHCYITSGVLTLVYSACLMVGSVIRILNKNYDLYYLELIGLGIYGIVTMWISFAINRLTLGSGDNGDMAPSMITTIGVVLIAVAYFFSYKGKFKNNTIHDLSLAFGIIFIIIIGSRMGYYISQISSGAKLGLPILAIIASICAIDYTIEATLGIIVEHKKIKQN